MVLIGSIKERRIVVKGISVYLQNPKEYEEDLNRADNIFKKEKRNAI